MANKLMKIGPVTLLVVVLLIWLATGFYTVDSEGGEAAVVLRFGNHVDTVYDAGLHWHLPSPIETVEKERLKEIRTIELGYRTTKIGSTFEYSEYQIVPSEARMLTQDENLVDVETVIQYEIVDIEAYIFNVDDQEGTMTISAESAIRRVVANHSLDEVLTDNKSTIQSEILTDLQATVDLYDMGIQINNVVLQDVAAPQEVDAAFKDVANAREDKASYINEAETYANEILPKARGNAAEAINQAEAYKEKRISEAKGDVANFLAVLEKYELGEDVTRTRMYIETMEQILPGMSKYIVSSDDGTIKFLPLDGSTVMGGGQ
ncbi:MAG TPA: FtsH protease activity modulator HflK [Clostridia bacterium]|nr:FtsH protease activity modulator HflK [Clostridia bacterium]HPQ48027.1 FtsH protease activity modulator HflK [Clostridia bacterium]HRX42274.1 FtsH protease activity modulator HflK [Clostridia bacterium]